MARLAVGRDPIRHPGNLKRQVSDQLAANGDEFVIRPDWAQRVSSGILRWHQMVIGSKTCELFSPNHVDSIDAALAKASGFPSM
jgi:hypothetical protein